MGKKDLAYVAPGVLVVGFLLWCTISAIMSDGKVTHCIIERSDPIYKVTGFRHWRENVIVGVATTPEEADKIMRNSAVCSK